MSLESAFSVCRRAFLGLFSLTIIGLLVTTSTRSKGVDKLLLFLKKVSNASKELLTINNHYFFKLSVFVNWVS